MTSAFVAKEHHITLCLRDEYDGLITQTNLPSKVINRDNLKWAPSSTKLIIRLVPSPTTEALAVVTSLKVNSTRGSMGLPLKLALFNLQKYAKEEDFAVEFMLKGGMRILVRLFDASAGLSSNSLAVSCVDYSG